jgi:error-prone DNA polymerase
VAEQMAAPGEYTEQSIAGAAASRGSRPVVVKPVLVHPTGFRMSPYADIKPAGEDAMTVARRDATRRGTSSPPRKLWHSSPGSSGH